MVAVLTHPHPSHHHPQDYTHENRFASMKRDMHEIFREAFKGLGIEAVRLIVGHRNSPTLQREFIRKKPHMRLMTLKQQGKNDYSNHHTL
jgi:hypothetical protein